MTSNRQMLGHLLAQGLHGDKNYSVSNIWDPYEMLMYFFYEFSKTFKPRLDDMTNGFKMLRRQASNGF